jgi:predicted kinase
MAVGSGPAWAAGVIAAAITPATRLVAFIAVPGAGKSTITQLLAEQLPNALVICADAIRGELGDEADQSHTPKAFKIAFERLGPALDAGQTAIWDATNTQVWARRKLVDAARRPGLETLAVHLRVPLTVALRRNEHRSRQVRPGAIEHMHQDLAGLATDQLRQEGFTWALELAV